MSTKNVSWFIAPGDTVVSVGNDTISMSVEDLVNNNQGYFTAEDDDDPAQTWLCKAIPEEASLEDYTAYFVPSGSQTQESAAANLWEFGHPIRKPGK